MDRARLDRFISQRLVELPLGRPITLSSADSVRTAVSQMREGDHSCVLTFDDGALNGIFTERDVLSKCMRDGFDWDQSLRDAGMLCEPTTIGATRTVVEAIAVMDRGRYRTLPVMDGDQVLGIVRTADLLTSLVEAYPEDLLNLPPRPHQVMETREGG